VPATRDTYDPALTLRQARAAYFEANGFGADGGYNKTRVHLKLGWIPMVIPNPPARVAAVRFHDLHHIVTGYQTDWRGEFEISCFEIAAGCGALWFAWLINLGGVAGGLWLMPRRCARAWARGRATGGLYRTTFDDALLDRTVGELTTSLDLDRADPTPTSTDWLGLVGTGLAITAAGLAPIAAILGGLWAWLA